MDTSLTDVCLPIDFKAMKIVGVLMDDFLTNQYVIPFLMLGYPHSNEEPNITLKILNFKQRNKLVGQYLHQSMWKIHSGKYDGCYLNWILH